MTGVDVAVPKPEVAAETIVAAAAHIELAAAAGAAPTAADSDHYSLSSVSLV
jgi:hypothetical protein